MDYWGGGGGGKGYVGPPSQIIGGAWPPWPPPPLPTPMKEDLVSLAYEDDIWTELSWGHKNFLNNLTKDQNMYSLNKAET